MKIPLDQRLRRYGNLICPAAGKANFLLRIQLFLIRYDEWNAQKFLRTLDVRMGDGAHHA
jgi:hypothetical protein